MSYGWSWALLFFRLKSSEASIHALFLTEYCSKSHIETRMHILRIYLLLDFNLVHLSKFFQDLLTHFVHLGNCSQLPFMFPSFRCSLLILTTFTKFVMDPHTQRHVSENGELDGFREIRNGNVSEQIEAFNGRAEGRGSFARFFLWVSCWMVLNFRTIKSMSCDLLWNSK